MIYFNIFLWIQLIRQCSHFMQACYINRFDDSAARQMNSNLKIPTIMPIQINNWKIVFIFVCFFYYFFCVYIIRKLSIVDDAYRCVFEWVDSATVADRRKAAKVHWWSVGREWTEDGRHSRWGGESPGGPPGVITYRRSRPLKLGVWVAF